MEKVLIFSIFAFVTMLSIAPVGFALYPSATPWSTYRYDTTHSGATPSDAPSSNSTLWGWGISAAALSVVSTPLVVDGRVIFQVRELAVSVDETTGVELWRHGTSGSLTASAYADGRVFFSIYQGVGGVICINASTGAEIWNQPTSPYFGTSSPLVHRGTVYAGVDDNRTHAFDAATGHHKWGYKTDGPVYSSPAADGDLLFFGSDDTKLYALNISGPTPVSLWNFTANGAIRSTPAIYGGRVFFGSDNNRLYAVNKTTGELTWSWATATPSAKIRNGVAVANNIVYVTSEDVTKIYALHADVAAGNYTETDFDIRYWIKDISAYGVSGFREPVYAGGKIIVASTGGDPAMLFALDADVGNTLWDRGWRWWPNLGNPVVADGRMFVNAYWDGDSMSYGLYCLGLPFPPSTSHYTIDAGGTSFDVALETNSTVSNFDASALETQGKLSFKVKGIGTTGMSNVTIPNDMLDGALNVTVDGGQPQYSASPLNNGTHTSLYFTYNNTIQHLVEITGTTFIPEFHPIVVVPLMTAVFFVVLLKSKKIARFR
jgi:outer membrane protein assembly factor BamB